MESLGLCAGSGGGRECVARRFGPGVRTRNRDGACDGSPLFEVGLLVSATKYSQRNWGHLS